MTDEADEYVFSRLLRKFRRRNWVEDLDASPRFRVLGWFITLIGMIIGLIALLAWFFTLEHRSISVLQTERRPLVIRNADAPPTAVGKLQILYDGKDVRSPWTCTYQFANSGNVGFAYSDIENGTITLDFGQADIKSADVLPGDPDAIRPIVSHDSHSVTLEFKNGNWSRGEQFKISVILDGEPALPTVHYRIKDVLVTVVKDVSANAVEARKQYPSSSRIAAICVFAAPLTLLFIYLVCVLLYAFGMGVNYAFFLEPDTTAVIWRRVCEALDRKDRSYPEWNKKHAGSLLVALSKSRSSSGFPMEWFTAPNQIDEFLTQPASSDVLTEHNVTPENAKQQILDFLKKDLYDTAEMRLWAHHLPRWQKQVKTELSTKDFSSPKELENQVTSVLQSNPPERASFILNTLRVIGEMTLLVAIAFMIFSIISALLLLLWQRLLT